MRVLLNGELLHNALTTLSASSEEDWEEEEAGPTGEAASYLTPSLLGQWQLQDERSVQLVLQCDRLELEAKEPSG